MFLRSAVIVACAGIALGCGARSTTTGPAATSSTADECVDLARHVASVVEAEAPDDRRPGPPLLIELWTSLYVDACRQDGWSEPTFACYRAASSSAMLDACEAAQPEPERTGLRRLTRDARAYLPAREQATGTRDEVQARYVMPIWGHPPAAGDTFALCDTYAELLATLSSCTTYQDPFLRERIGILDAERARFRDRSRRVRGMWLGYCEAETARRRRQSPECLTPPPDASR
jgi:hypothetical protein